MQIDSFARVSIGSVITAGLWRYADDPSQTITQLVFGTVADVTLVSSVYASVFNKDIATGRDLGLTAFERGMRMGTVFGGAVAKATTKPFAKAIQDRTRAVVGRAKSWWNTPRKCKTATACFVSGTQVVNGREVLEIQAPGEEAESRSLGFSNLLFAGLALGFASTSVVVFKKQKRRTRRIMDRFKNISVPENESKPPTETALSETNHDPGKVSLMKPFLASIFFVLSILCGYFALQTSTTVAVPAPTTQIVERYTTKNIEDIREGDEVLACDIRTGEVVKKRVTAVFERKTDHIRYLKVESESGHVQTFETTDSHPYWVAKTAPDLDRMARERVKVKDVDGEPMELFHENLAVTQEGFYVEASDLKVGDVFLGPCGELSRLLESHRLDKPYGETVYNFSVADDHNYFVIANSVDYISGAEPVLVHNAAQNGACGVTDRPQVGDIMSYKEWQKVKDKGDLRGHHPVSQKVLEREGYDPMDAPVLIMRESPDHQATVNWGRRGNHSQWDFADAIEKGLDDPVIKNIAKDNYDQLVDLTLDFLGF